MGSGCSGNSKNQSVSSTCTGTPTKEQWEEISREVIGDDFSDGAWWWGHPNGDERPADAEKAMKLVTGALPAYYQDLLLLKHCPSYLDAQAWGKPGVKCPFLGGTAYLGHKDVSELLAACPAEQAKGTIERRNELGYLVLTDKAFLRTKHLGLANDFAMHHKQRHAMRLLLADMPRRHGWLKEVREFLRGRTSIAFPADVFTWWTQMLWRHVLQKELTWDEAAKFNKFRDSWLAAAVVHAGDLSIANLTFTMDDVNRDQDSWWERIKHSLQPLIDKGLRVAPEDVGDVAQAVLEMLCFAGGLSVPQTIASAVAALYQDFMPQPVSEDNVVPFVYEVTRLFPAVQGFAWWRDNHRHIASLSGALRDPAAWGKDADKFVIRRVDLYEEKHVGFANPACAKDECDSRYCPGISAALESVQAFVLALGRWAPKGERLASIWRPSKPIEPAGKPNWWKTFTLVKVQGRELSYYEELLDGDRTGESDLGSLSPQQFQRLMSKMDADRDGRPDVIGEMDPWTRILYTASKSSWEENSSIDAIDPPFAPKHTYGDGDSALLPIGGIRMPTSDEQWTGEPWMQSVALALFGRIEKATDDAIPESLKVHTPEQRQEAIAMGQQAFYMSGDGPRSYLPTTKNTWTELASDGAQALFAKYGFGQLFLKRNPDPEAAEKYGANVVCDASLLASFPVRPAFERLGAVAYFKWESGGTPEITAIDWKHGGRVLTPEDGDEWEHAKYVWRCSVGTLVTAVNHLTWTHWITANAVSTAIREAFDPDHPIRRLLHVNTFNTASINSLSFSTLYAENGILHHMCALTYEGLESAFKAANAAFEYKTWPQFYESVDLPDEVKSTLPMFEDGLDLWAALREFYEAYISLYYCDDNAVKGDPGIQTYWEFRCSPQYAVKLPALTKAALIDQITQAVFDVTAYHEFVGQVVGYLSDPAGSFMQVRPGCNMADKQHMLEALSLCASTGSPMPRFIDDWTKILEFGDPNTVRKVKEAWHEMAARLLKLSGVISERNKTRPQPFSQFDPQYLEISVNL